MRTIKGPAIFLAQFAGDAAPFDGLAGIARWAAGHGYKGVQIPSWDARLIDLPPVAFPHLPDDAGMPARTVAAGVILLFRCRWSLRP